MYWSELNRADPHCCVLMWVILVVLKRLKHHYYFNIVNQKKQKTNPTYIYLLKFRIIIPGNISNGLSQSSKVMDLTK